MFIVFSRNPLWTTFFLITARLQKNNPFFPIQVLLGYFSLFKSTLICCWDLRATVFHWCWIQAGLEIQLALMVLCWVSVFYLSFLFLLLIYIVIWLKSKTLWSTSIFINALLYGRLKWEFIEGIITYLFAYRCFKSKSAWSICWGWLSNITTHIFCRISIKLTELETLLWLQKLINCGSLQSG